jgi:hypothetical protein
VRKLLLSGEAMMEHYVRARATALLQARVSPDLVCTDYGPDFTGQFDSG